MRADRVKVSLGRTIPTNVQYDMIRLDVSVEQDVEEGSTHKEVYNVLLTEVEELVKETIRGYKAEINGKSKK